MSAARFVLWGKMRSLDWKPIRISGGNLRDCRAELRRRSDRVEGRDWRDLTILPEGEPYGIEGAL